MATIAFKGNSVETEGNLPSIGSTAPDFKLVRTDLSEISLKDFAGKTMVLNIFPSLDTGTCAASVRKFNAEASKLTNTVVICISRDLPFAHNRFCTTEGLSNVVSASEYRDDSFSKAYGVKFKTGPLVGLLSRSVVVIDQKGKVIYTEQVAETVNEPNYEAALKSIK